jgi:hypothetical protein
MLQSCIIGIGHIARGASGLFSISGLFINRAAIHPYQSVEEGQD